MPSHLPSEIRSRLLPIRLLVLDVDGVLTDGKIHIGAEGELFKTFSVRDGLAIRLLDRAGIAVAVITGRRSQALLRRCEEIGIPEQSIIQGSRDKMADLTTLQERLGIDDAATAAIGDDLPDLPLLGRAGLAACPSDAAPEVVAAADIVCRAGGGQGAVRELVELILKGQQRWAEATRSWLGRQPGSDD